MLLFFGINTSPFPGRWCIIIILAIGCGWRETGGRRHGAEVRNVRQTVNESINGIERTRWSHCCRTVVQGCRENYAKDTVGKMEPLKLEEQLESGRGGGKKKKKKKGMKNVRSKK